MINFADYLPKDKTKRLYAILGIIAALLVVIGLSAWGIWYGMHTTTTTVSNQNIAVSEKIIPSIVDKKQAESTTAARRLDGMMVSKGDSNIWPVCIMVENAAFDGVRPQAGLSQALVVYEITVEGGITRLMGVFSGQPDSKIGPVRSARDTYIEFVSEMDCLYGYAGGSFTALLATQNLDLKTLNALSSDGKYYWRDTSLYAPHNLFTSSDLLTLALRDKQLTDKTPTFDSWKFRDQPKTAPTSASLASEVKIDFSSPEYAVRWVYNADQGIYERYDGGVLQTDRNNGQTISAHNIVVELVPPGQEIEGKGRINFSVTGEGQVLVFRNGEVVKGNWKKTDRVSRTQYVDEAGRPIELNRGNTWVEVVPTDRSVTY